MSRQRKAHLDEDRLVWWITHKEKEAMLEEMRDAGDCKATLADLPTYGATIADKTGYGRTREEALDDLDAALLAAEEEDDLALQEELEARKRQSTG